MKRRVAENLRGLTLRRFLLNLVIFASLRAQGELLVEFNKVYFERQEVISSSIVESFACCPLAIPYIKVLRSRIINPHVYGLNEEEVGGESNTSRIRVA